MTNATLIPNELSNTRIDAVVRMAQEEIRRHPGTGFKIRNLLDDLNRFRPAPNQKCFAKGKLAQKNQEQAVKIACQLVEQLLDQPA